jgi:hypothetical protein
MSTLRCALVLRTLRCAGVLRRAVSEALLRGIPERLWHLVREWRRSIDCIRSHSKTTLSITSILLGLSTLLLEVWHAPSHGAAPHFNR